MNPVFPDDHNADWADWNRLLTFFTTRSPDFPELCLHNLSAVEVQGAFELFYGPQSRLIGSPQVFDRRISREVPLATLESPVALVHSAEIEPFHCLIGNLRVGDTTLPDIGLFVLPGAIAIDFQPGPAWNAASMETLLRLLDQVVLLAEQPQLSLEETLSPALQQAFITGLDLVHSIPAGCLPRSLAGQATGSQQEDTV